MILLVQAHEAGRVQEFERILRERRDSILGGTDDFIESVLEALLRTIRTSVLLKLIRPYKRIKLSYLAGKLSVSEDNVEQLLVALILDKRVAGHVDQVGGSEVGEVGSFRGKRKRGKEGKRGSGEVGQARWSGGAVGAVAGTFGWGGSGVVLARHLWCAQDNTPCQHTSRLIHGHSHSQRALRHVHSNDTSFITHSHPHPHSHSHSHSHTYRMSSMFTTAFHHSRPCHRPFSPPQVQRLLVLQQEATSGQHRDYYPALSQWSGQLEVLHRRIQDRLGDGSRSYLGMGCVD